MATAVAIPHVSRSVRRPASKQRRRARTRTPRAGGGFEPVAERWQVALDRAQRALEAATPTLPAAELAHRRTQLARERGATAIALQQSGSGLRLRHMPWLSVTPLTPARLGLPDRTLACLFDLDDVLVNSGVLHATAWARALDAFLERMADRTGCAFTSFDTGGDYHAYFDGHPRLEGIHLFLDSRGIDIPDGRRGDVPGTETAFGLAAAKRAALAHDLRKRRVAPIAGARRYLEAVGHAGLGRAVISASASTAVILELTELASLVEVRIDASAIRTGHLRSRPAPDALLEACRRLSVPPACAVYLTHHAPGVAAAHAVGISAIAVGDDAGAARQRPKRIVPSLDALLDHDVLLAAGRDGGRGAPFRAAAAGGVHDSS